MSKMREENRLQRIPAKWHSGTSNCGSYLRCEGGRLRAERTCFPFDQKGVPSSAKRTTGEAIRPFLEIYSRLHLGQIMSSQYDSRFVLTVYSNLPHEQ